EEARKAGLKIKALYGPIGPTGNFLAQKPNGHKFRFEVLPDAGFLSKYGPGLVDDKKAAKGLLQKAGLPVPPSKFFWFFRQRAAFKYGLKLDWPLVVKPRSGSVARHCYTNITTPDQLKIALKKVVVFSPCLVVERYLAGCSVYRATVVDFTNVFCCQQIPANVVGDGQQTIRQLIDQKNNLPNRGRVQQNNFTLFQIKEDAVTQDLLDKMGYNFSTVPPAGEKVFLQKNPFLRLGGDIAEVTEKMHPDNKELFERVARLFGLRLVGIDFLASDIAVSWQKQACAILEVNVVPCIEMHQMPSDGQPQNISQKVVDLALKYY
ncbi:MAG: hypothetical protein AAB740_04150, partial [Patescibacteria group bacterium]